MVRGRRPERPFLKEDVHARGPGLGQDVERDDFLLGPDEGGDIARASLRFSRAVRDFPVQTETALMLDGLGKEHVRPGLQEMRRNQSSSSVFAIGRFPTAPFQ